MITSNDSTGRTFISFDAPIFLLNNTSYAFVIKPEGNNDRTVLWVSKIGGLDIISNEKITEQPYSGSLFASSNDNVYEPIQDEDIKFEMYRASFTAASGSCRISNENVDYLNVNAISNNFTSNEIVRGETLIVPGEIKGQDDVAVGDIVQNATGVSGIVSIVDALDYRIRIRSVTLGKNFAVNDILTFKNGSTTKDVTVRVNSVTSSEGILNRTLPIDASSSEFTLNFRSGNVISVGEVLQGTESGSTATVTSVIDKPFSVFNPQASQIVVSRTSIDWFASYYDNLYNKHSGIGFQINNNVELDNEALVVSYSNSSKIDNNKSLVYEVTMSTISNWLSPVIDTTRIHSIFVKNVVNNDSSNENGTSGGNALARYISRKVTLGEDQDAEDLLVYLSAYKPVLSDIKVYAKLLHNEDSDLFDDVSWKELALNSKQFYSDSQNKDDFKEFTFKLNEADLGGENLEYEYVNSNGVVFTGYKYFAIKIVFLTENAAVVPRCKDLRAIALQK